MVILTPIERQIHRVFTRKTSIHSCHCLPLGGSSNKYGIRQTWAVIFLNTQEPRPLDYYIDVCRITKVGYIEHLWNNKITWRVSLFIGVRITTIRCAVHLLPIFKMFQGHLNNLVLSAYLLHKPWRTELFNLGIGHRVVFKVQLSKWN
jgi:hypothetical protein